MKVALYTRVSTSSQDYHRQISELSEYCKKQGWEIAEVFSEKISGAKKNHERAELINLIEFVKSNNVDKVVVWELSRLGRNTLEVLKSIELLSSEGISLYIKNYSLETLNENGKPNAMATLMVQILSSISEMERSLTRDRMLSGYNEYRKHSKVGRKEGFRKSQDQILEDHKEVVKYLKKGRSVREIMKLTNKSNGTVMKVKRILG